MSIAALGPHSRPHMLAKLDGRRREAKLLAAKRDELTRHCGGHPNSVQRTLIERASRLQLYLALMDAETSAAGTMSERNSRQYLAWTNSLRLCLRELGAETRSQDKPTLAAIAARHRSAGA